MDRAPRSSTTATTHTGSNHTRFKFQTLQQIYDLSTCKLFAMLFASQVCEDWDETKSQCQVHPARLPQRHRNGLVSSTLHQNVINDEQK